MKKRDGSLKTEDYGEHTFLKVIFSNDNAASPQGTKEILSSPGGRGGRFE